MIRLFQTLMKAASRVIHIGGFGVLHDSTISRLVSSGSCVVPVGGSSVWSGSLIDRLSSFGSSVIHVEDSMPLRHFRVYPLPMGDRFGIPFSPILLAANSKRRRRRLTSRDTQPPLAALFSMFFRNPNLNPAFDARPR